MDARLKEAARLGFEVAFVPEGSSATNAGLTLKPIQRLNDLVAYLAPDVQND